MDIQYSLKWNLLSLLLKQAIEGDATTGAVLDRQNTSSQQPPAQYGRR